MSNKVKIKFIRRPLIQRFGASPIAVSMEDAVRYIKNRDAVAVSDMDGPPVNKMVTHPGVKKGGQTTTVNPTLKKKKKKQTSPTPSGEPKMTIRLKR